MFTGLIETVGRVDRLDRATDKTTLVVATPLAAELHPGDSVAVSGVCLTVTAADRRAFHAIVSPETLRVTTLGDMAEGRLVNLERPLRADGRLGGHFVLGHVDGVGRIARLVQDADCHWLDVELPSDLLSAVVHKGSLAIDGISLTVAALAGQVAGVQIVPFTFAETALREARKGDRVNVEADVIGKYVSRWLDQRQETAAGEPAMVRRS